MYGASDGPLSFPIYLPLSGPATLLGLLPEIATKSENDKILQRKVEQWKEGRKG